MIRLIPFFSVVLLGAAGCDAIPTVEDKPVSKRVPVAQVGDNVLYESDLQDIFTKDLSEEDSLKLRRNFINNWTQQTLLYLKALDKLTDEQKDKDRQLDDYYRSLIIYEYEKAYVNRNVDTVVSMDEVIAYYDNHRNEFKLDRNIVKLIYVMVRKDAEGQEVVEKYYDAKNPAEFDELYTYCLSNAENFSLNDQEWIRLDEVLGRLPIGVTDQRDFLKTTKNKIISDSLFNYYISLRDYRLVGDVSPREFERENIKSIIAHKRRRRLLDRLRLNIYEEARETGLIKTEIE